MKCCYREWRQLITQHYNQLAVGINTKSYEQPVMIYNSLPWERNEWLYIQDSWKHVTVPSMGYQVVEAAGSLLSEVFDLTAESNLLENEYLRISFLEMAASVRFMIKN